MRGCSCYIYSLYTVSFLTPARILPSCFFLMQAGWIDLFSVKLDFLVSVIPQAACHAD